MAHQAGRHNLQARIPELLARSALEKISHCFRSERPTAVQPGRQKIREIQCP
jgi:hypothetical protein